MNNLFVSFGVVFYNDGKVIIYMYLNLYISINSKYLFDFFEYYLYLWILFLRYLINQ